MIHLDGDLTVTNTLDGDMQISESFDGIAGVLQKVIEVNPYDGEYSVTPSDAEQVLATEGKYLSQNVTIGPIPSNYGLITWNGLGIRVS